jgi:hypothetical protein
VAALTRYLASDLARSQRWLAPAFTYLVICLFNLAGSSAPGDALPTYADAAAALFPVAIWVTVVVGNCEDPVQTAITVAAAGSETLVRLAKLLVALTACAAFAVVSMAIARSVTGAAPVPDLLAGLAAHLIAATTGVAVGAWCMRPVLDRTAWAVLIGVLASLAEVLVPHCPPLRQMLVLLAADKPAHMATALGLIAGESVLIAAVAVVAALRLGRSRT